MTTLTLAKALNAKVTVIMVTTAITATTETRTRTDTASIDLAVPANRTCSPGRLFVFNYFALDGLLDAFRVNAHRIP